MTVVSKSSRWIAVAIGDPTGIGPEVTLKAIATELPADDARYLLLGDESLLTALNQCLGLNLPLTPFQNFCQTNRIAIRNPRSLPPSFTVAGKEAGQASLACLRAGAEHCLAGETAALVTAPVSKETIIRSGEPDFVGQTEFLSALAQTQQTAMMLLGCDDRGRWLRVALATNHVPLGRVATVLATDRIELTIGLAAESCRRLGLSRARVGVCGLNPHAGEGGKMGTEEITVIQPAVDATRRLGLDVHGPLAADTLFHFAFRGDYDAVVAMYHDQGLVPLKMIGFDTGVNWTLGLPFVRTSPDHGTAYDIAGRGVASPSSMIAALRLAKRLVHSGEGSSSVR